MCHPGRPGPHGLSHQGSPGLAAFQSTKVGDRIPFIFIGIHGGSGLHPLAIQVGQTAILGKSCDAVVDTPIADICQSLRLEGLDELDHLGNVVCCPGQEVGPLDLQGVQVFQEDGCEPVREGLHGRVPVPVGCVGRQGTLGIPDDFVLHVRDVHAVLDLMTCGPEGSFEEILEQEGPQVSDVGVIVDGGTTGVQGDLPLRHREHGFHLTRQGVEQ